MSPARLAEDNRRRRIVRLVLLGWVLVGLMYVVDGVPSQ
jgi:hypothetical protein